MLSLRLLSRFATLRDDLLIDYVKKTSILTLSNNIGLLDNQLKVSASLTSLLYCLLLTSVFGTFALLWILAIPSRLSVVGLGRCFCLLSPTKGVQQKMVQNKEVQKKEYANRDILYKPRYST